MAVHDHTVPARLSFSSSGDPFRDSPAADPMAHGPQVHSLRLFTLDDVALALYCLAQRCVDDERDGMARARHSSAEPIAWPLPPRLKQDVTVANQCLEQYAKQLGDERTMNG